MDSMSIDGLDPDFIDDLPDGLDWMGDDTAPYDPLDRPYDLAGLYAADDDSEPLIDAEDTLAIAQGSLACRAEGRLAA